MTMLAISMGSIDMNTGTPDSDGSVWYCTSLDGWDAPEVRFSSQPRTGDHGVVVTDMLLDARPMTLAGVCKPNSEAGYWASRNRLASVAAGLKPGLLKVGESTAKQANVWLAGKPRADLGSRGGYKFEIPLTAPDPRKYGQTLVSTALSAGANVLANSGTAPTFAQVTVNTSGAPDLNMSGQGDFLVTSALDAGVVIDFENRTVKTSGGVSQYTRIGPNPIWWVLNSGNNTLNVTLGGGTYTIAYRPAWF